MLVEQHPGRPTAAMTMATGLKLSYSRVHVASLERAPCAGGPWTCQRGRGMEPLPALKL